MRRRLSLSRRLSTAARWPVGVSLTSWRYLWRTVPLHRTDEEGNPEADYPPALPAGIELEDVQHPDDGFGPLFHRRYRTRIREAQLTAEALMERVAADPDCASPTEFASFVKLHGEPGRMRVGDEYLVRMAGPWDGPVRVIGRTSTSFRLVTLDGHLEAGQIRFSAEPRDGLIEFEIESWARSSGRVVHLLYDRLRMAKEVQLHMWTSMLQRIAELAGGRVTDGIDIHTRRVSEGAPPGSRSASPPSTTGRSTTTRTPRIRSPRAGASTTSARCCRPSRPGRRSTADRFRSPRRCCATTGSRTRASSAPTTTATLRWRAATCCSSCASWSSEPSAVVGSVGSPTRSGWSTAGRCRSGAGPTRRSRATSSRARCPGRSGSGWTPARSSSAFTPTRGWWAPRTRSRSSASGCSVSGSDAGT